MEEKTVYHIDVNSAYLSWEAVYRLKFLGARTDLRRIPSAIGGDISQRHGIILAKSIPAKRYKVHTGEPVPQARQKCPDLLIAPPNYGLYERCSRAFVNILKEYSPDVEQYSIDEVYMDMTQTIHLYGDPVQTAFDIKDRIKKELGFTVNVGISTNKVLAKMASEFRKPDRVHTLYPPEIPRKMWPLPVEELFFVGKASAGKLRKLGIETIGELAEADPELLRRHLKSHGEVIWNFANGRDFSVVQPVEAPNKGYGNSTTISFDVKDAATAKIVLLGLAETLGMRIRKDKAEIQVVSLDICDWEFNRISHQRVLENPTDITKEIYQAAARLLDEAWNKMPIRKLGIHTGKAGEAGWSRQMNLFDSGDYLKEKRWDRTIDHIRYRHGMDAIKRAVFLGQPRIDHLSGGISREKRSVDYAKIKID